jgi:PTH2 family peptidyl-tRNA hydrolase
MEKIAKQVIVIRKDLNMRKGKMVAQGAHASMKFILDRGYYGRAELDHDEEFHSKITDPAIKEWISGIFTKICVSVDSEEELTSIYEKAKDAGLIVSMVTDSGLTEFSGVPTKTCIAIGPNWSHEIDEITRNLKLL